MNQLETIKSQFDKNNYNPQLLDNLIQTTDLSSKMVSLVMILFDKNTLGALPLIESILNKTSEYNELFKKEMINSMLKGDQIVNVFILLLRLDYSEAIEECLLLLLIYKRENYQLNSELIEKCLGNVLIVKYSAIFIEYLIEYLEFDRQKPLKLAREVIDSCLMFDEELELRVFLTCAKILSKHKDAHQIKDFMDSLNIKQGDKEAVYNAIK